jgi:AcrR family transcriptional regulator
MPTRQEQKSSTRAQILRAAAAEFAARGFAGATFASIAAAMGKPKSALGYHQFRSKDEIALAILTEQYERWESFRVAVDATVPAGLPRALSLLLTTALDARENPFGLASVRLLLDAQPSGLEFTRPPFSWLAVITASVHDAVVLQQLPDAASPDDLAAMIVSASLGIFEAENAGAQPMNTERALRAQWLNLLTGAGAADPRAVLAETRSLAGEAA